MSWPLIELLSRSRLVRMKCAVILGQHKSVGKVTTALYHLLLSAVHAKRKSTVVALVDNIPLPLLRGLSPLLLSSFTNSISLY